MSARLSVRERDLRNSLSRRLCVDSVVVIEDATVSMRGVFAQANVGRDVEGREGVSNAFDSLNNRPFYIICRCPFFVLQTRQVGSVTHELSHLFSFQRDTEQDNTCQSLLNQWSKEFFQPVYTPAALTRQSRNVNFG